MIIAIDGPSAAGKSTLAKRIAKDLGFTYLDTGGMYRALALKVLREGIDIGNDGALTKLIGRTDIDLVETEGKLKVLVDKVVQLTEAREALRVIEDREVFGKIVVSP